MRRAGRFNEKLVLATLVLGASLTTGCKTYHYYDIDVKFSASFGGISNAGMIQVCSLNVSGADSGGWTFPNNDSTGAIICPIQNNYPDLGTFEFSTFEDSGNLHFLVSAYTMAQQVQANCFAAGSTDIQASSAITTMGNITLNMTTSGCAQ